MINSDISEFIDRRGSAVFSKYVDSRRQHQTNLPEQAMLQELNNWSTLRTERRGNTENKNTKHRTVCAIKESC